MTEESRTIEAIVNFELEDIWRPMREETWRRTWFVYVIFGLFSLVALAISLYWLIAVGDAKFVVVLIGPALLGIAVAVGRRNVYKNAKRTFETVNGPVKWRFTNEGFSTEATAGSTDQKWESLEELKETEHEFLLYPQKPMFIILPKKSFASGQDIDGFRELALNGLGTKAKLKK